jgi:two-component system sensor histidine kinase VicK
MVILQKNEKSANLISHLRTVYSQAHILLLIPLDTQTSSGFDPTDSPDSSLLYFAHSGFQQVIPYIRLYLQNHALAATVRHLEAEQVRHRQRIEEVELLKNAIVKNVSHELRTPLLQVKSAVSMLAEDNRESKLIAYAENATARLETHVKNITMLGQSLDINPSPIVLRDTIEYARRNLSRVWELRSEIDRIQVNIEHDLPPILADKHGISTVLQLLMDNALKFSDRGIEVTAARSAERVRIRIHDSGIGIPADKLETIFDIFYQVDTSSTRRYGGTGVGLTIVKLILDRHNSTIHVESTPNVGSTFWFEMDSIDLSAL